MTSKWIKEIQYNLDNADAFELDVQHVVERIDKLLRKAMSSVDDENLHEEIRKEITND